MAVHSGGKHGDSCESQGILIYTASSRLFRQGLHNEIVSKQRKKRKEKKIPLRVMNLLSGVGVIFTNFTAPMDHLAVGAHPQLSEDPKLHPVSLVFSSTAVAHS